MKFLSKGLQYYKKGLGPAPQSVIEIYERVFLDPNVYISAAGSVASGYIANTVLNNPDTSQVIPWMIAGGALTLIGSTISRGYIRSRKENPE